eukprot:UN04205
MFAHLARILTAARGSKKVSLKNFTQHRNISKINNYQHRQQQQQQSQHNL